MSRPVLHVRARARSGRDAAPSGDLKVLHVLSSLQPSGAEICLRIAGSAWHGLGIKCDILATGSVVGPYATQLRDAAYRVGHLSLDPFSRFVPRFLRLLRHEKYDIVHTHIERANFYVDLMAFAADAKVIQQLHGLFVFDGNLRIERTIQRRLLSLLGVRFIAVSEDVAANERERFGTEAEVFLNWADVDYFDLPSMEQRRSARASFGLREDDYVIVSVANCHAIKNHLTAVEALSMLPSHVRWLHVGSGVTEGQEREAAERLGVAERMTFLGHRDPRPALHAADLFAMNSHSEGLGLSAVEALVTGLPAVLSDVRGLRNLRHFDVAAYWCDVTATSLADNIRRAMVTPPEGSVNALRSAFDASKRVPMLATLYRDLRQGTARQPSAT